MFKKFFLFTGFLLLAAMLFAPAAFAADGRMHELNYFHTDVLEENGRDVLRIEIGMNRTDLAYTVQKNEAKPKQLIIDRIPCSAPCAPTPRSTAASAVT